MTNKANNVVTFPKKNANLKEHNIEDIHHNLEMMKQYHIQETILNLTPIIFNQLDIAGFGITDDDDISDLKDGAFIVEALRSYMCKYYGAFHPFQIIAENVFEQQKNKDDQESYKIVDEINLNLKDPEEESEPE